MSMLMLNRSSLTIITIHEERERRGTARVEVFSGGTPGTVRSRKKAISIVPRTSTAPPISADRSGQVSPATLPANTASLSPLALLPHLQCPSNAICQSFLDLDLLDSFPLVSGTSALVIPAPQSFFSKTLGCTLKRKSTCSTTYSLIEEVTSICSLNT